MPPTVIFMLCLILLISLLLLVRFKKKKEPEKPKPVNQSFQEIKSESLMLPAEKQKAFIKSLRESERQVKKK